MICPALQFCTTSAEQVLSFYEAYIFGAWGDKMRDQGRASPEKEEGDEWLKDKWQLCREEVIQRIAKSRTRGKRKP